MRVHATTDTTGDVTLVAVRLTNPASRPKRVRLANRLDGPVWPPRIGGRPAPGWDDGGYEGVLEARETRTLGYATSATPVDDREAEPVEVAWVEDAPDGPPEEPMAPGVIVSRLGNPRPPIDAIPGHEEHEAVPPDVTAWLDRVETRVAKGTATPADRETLDRVLARATELRRTAWSR